MYSCVSLLLLAGNLSREHMIRITIVRLVGKVHFWSDYDILGHDKVSFPKIRFIRVGYVVVLKGCPGIFFAILGRGPRAFQIGKISAVNHYFGKFSKQTRTAFLVSLKTKLAITHTIAIKLKENRMQF